MSGDHDDLLQDAIQALKGFVEAAKGQKLYGNCKVELFFENGLIVATRELTERTKKHKSKLKPT